MNPEHVPSFIPPKIVAKLQELGLVVNNAEHGSVRWFDHVFTVRGAQQVCWQALFQNFTRGNLPIPQGRVLSEWHGSSTTAADILKRHPAWKSVIVGDGRGHLWLHVPEDSLERLAKNEPPLDT